MDTKAVIDILEANKNERGIAHWEKSGIGGMKGYGIGLTQLKKIAKTVGKDHELAMELWEMPIFEARLLATMVDEPKKVTREQVEKQIDDLQGWGMCHAWVSNLMPKVPFMQELMEEWIPLENNIRRQAGYGMLYILARDNKKLPDSYFVPHIDHIEAHLQSESNFVKDGMNNALLMIGQRSAALHARTLKAAKNIGTVIVDYGDNSCEAVDVVKHLEGERIRKKVGILK